MAFEPLGRGEREGRRDRRAQKNRHAGARAGGQRQDRAAAKVAKAATAAKTNIADVAQLDGAKRAAMPARLAPALTTLVKAAPGGERLDPRGQVRRLPHGVPARERQGAAFFAQRQGMDRQIPRARRRPRSASQCKSAWIDGEVCAVDDKGRSNFQALQNALADSAGAQLAYFVFDVIYLDGYDLRGVPLVERKRVLRGVVDERAAASATART